ncbi:MAG: DUF3297 family protein [Hyphomicrobiales bacterium]|nr:DUF3297 family protein [Hyphomicrobiales bacterium]
MASSIAPAGHGRQSAIEAFERELSRILPLSDDTSPQTDTPPDRLSVNPDSPYYNEAVLARDVGIKFKGAEKTNVEEYCVSEGWIRVSVGNTRDRKGNPLTLKLTGKVEPYYKS